MNLDLIRSFAILGERCHFGAAAEALGMSQPSLTKQIRRLEDLLGAPLFRRNRQGTELTAFGRRFLEDVQPVLRHAGAVWEKGLNAARGDRGHLAIGFTFSGIEVMARILRAFQQRHPGVDLFFDDVASDVQVKRVADGTLDIGFARIPIGADLAYRRVASDRLVFVYPAALGEEVTDFESKAVRGIPFISLQEHIAPGLEKQIQRLFLSRGFQPSITQRVNGPLTILALVASGLGVGLMHQSTVRGIIDRVGGARTRPLADPFASWDVGLIWRHDEQNPAVIRFLATAKHVLAAEPNAHPEWRIPKMIAKRPKK
jgi:DNA-binding transcriptional LysR family regulator